MSRTGSTYERKRPGSQLPRLRLALIGGLLLAAVTTARAGWVTTSVPGTPKEVRVWAPGVYSVVSSDGARLYRPDAGTPTFIPIAGDTAVGAYLSPTNCFVGIASTGDMIDSPNCVGATPIMSTSTLRRVRFTESGAGYAVAEDSSQTDSKVAYGAMGINSSPWTEDAQAITGTPTEALGVLRLGSTEEALVALNRINGLSLVWYRGGVNTFTFPLTDTQFPARDVQAIDLFPGGASTPTALFGWATGLYRGTLATGDPQPFSMVPLPVPAGTVTGVDVNPGAGSALGDGFGMATVVGPGGVSLLSAVPAGQAQDIGKQWRVNPTLPAAATSPRYLECNGAAFCVIAQKTPNTNNVFVYTNAAPPTIIVDPEPFALSEQEVHTFSISATDPDGDAVRLVVTPGTPSGPGVSVTPADTPAGVNLQVSSTPICQPVSVPVTVTASDGLAAHDQTRNFTLQVLHTRAPAAPAVGFSLQTVTAGDADVTITVAPPQPTPTCPIQEYRWSAISPGAPALAVSPDGRSAVFPTPSSPLCNNRLGESHVYRVEAVDNTGLASAPTYFTLQVLPWRPPRAPFDQDQTVNLIAGEPVKWLEPVQPVHVCATPGTDYPGVDTLWEVTQGAPVPLGIRLVVPGPGDPVAIAGESAVTPKLGIDTDPCVEGQLELSAQHYPRDGFTAPGPTSTVRVNVTPQLTPLDQVTMELTSRPPTKELVSGEVSAPKLDCPELRGTVRALVTLTRDDGVSREQIVPVPGNWWFALGDLCRTATYTVKGELQIIPKLRSQELQGGEQGASVGAFRALPPIEVPVDPPTLEAIENAHLTVRCGEPASGTLEQLLSVGPCSELPVTWKQDAGPPLTEETFTGQRIDLTTKGTDFGALIGESVEMLASVTVEGKEISRLHPVRILAEPFIEARRQIEKLTGSDTDLVGVTVELTNTTACGVSEVKHEERLEGVDYVPGSARLDGVPVEASVEGDVLTMQGLVLEGNTTGRLTYVVRPRLLATASLRGQSFLREVPISRQQVEPSTSGCGCAGGGSGFAALGLAGLAAVLRRRKAR